MLKKLKDIWLNMLRNLAVAWWDAVVAMLRAVLPGTLGELSKALLETGKVIAGK